MPDSLSVLAPLFLAAQGPAGAPVAEAVASQSRTLLSYIHDGGVLSYVLVGVSVVAVALILRNLLDLRFSRLAPHYIYDQLERFAREGDTAGAIDFCSKPENTCVLSTVVLGGLERASTSSLGLFELREGMEEAGRHEIDTLHRSNDGVGIISAVGPMLGLLGTVIGMIGAFGSISALQGAARSSELARFMSMALVCTAEGLVVAIPCTVAFALFRRRIDRFAGELAQDAEQLARQFLAAAPATNSTGPASLVTGQSGPGARAASLAPAQAAAR